MNSSYEAMINRVIAYRNTLQISQRDFGELLGISQGHYCKIEQGKKILSGAALKRLQAYSEDLDYFFTGKKKLVTELDGFFAQCPKEERYDFLELAIWLVNRGMGAKGPEGWECGSRQLVYLRSLAENRFSKQAIWYSIRRSCGLTQEEMAETLGVNIKKYRAIEKGGADTNVDAEILSNLYERLHFQPSLTLGEEDALLADVNLFWSHIRQDRRSRLVGILQASMELLEETLP